MRARSIYLAAPFFNPHELRLVQAIEEAVKDRPDVDLFSPRRDGGNADRQGDVTANATKIFHANVQAMRSCNECVAVLDRVQPPGFEVWLVKYQAHPDPKTPDELLPIKGPLEQPDLGTIWELGYLRAWRDLVIGTDFDIEVPMMWSGRKILAGFTMKPRAPGGKMNVMLARCLDVVLHGFEELQEWLAFPSASLALDHFQATGRAQWEGACQ